jgi:hypothetical protein
MWKNLEVDGKKSYKTFEHWDGRNKKRYVKLAALFIVNT